MYWNAIPPGSYNQIQGLILTMYNLIKFAYQLKVN